jgi:hypothetical protein
MTTHTKTETPRLTIAEQIRRMETKTEPPEPSVYSHELAEVIDERDNLREQVKELLAACKAWEYARKEGGISHADFYEAAWQKTSAAIAKAEKHQ